jgi:hypothetical protein
MITQERAETTPRVWMLSRPSRGAVPGRGGSYIPGFGGRVARRVGRVWALLKNGAGYGPRQMTPTEAGDETLCST